MSGRSALVVGATGLVGRCVVERLLGCPSYARVIVLARRPLAREDAKLETRVVDFEGVVERGEVPRVSDVFACLGTTIKIAGTQERFRRVDHDYTVEIARLSREQGATRLALVSSVGAAEKSSNFYLRVKGETERDVEALGFETLTIARPSILVGERNETRTGEALGLAAARALAFTMVGGLRAYRPIAAETVASALICATLEGVPGTRRLTFADMNALARSDAGAPLGHGPP